MALEQKLIQHLDGLYTHTVMTGLQPISAGMDIAYEAGRRIGVAQGMQLMINHIMNFYTEQDKDDQDL